MKHWLWGSIALALGCGLAAVSIVAVRISPLSEIKDWMSVVQAVLGIGTAALAFSAVNAWRQQTIGKRKVEVAEQTLTAFFEIQDALRGIRSRGILGFEGAEDSAKDQDPEETQRTRITRVVLERIRSERKLFAKLRTQKHVFTAYFGREAAQPFLMIEKILNDIILGAHMLAELHEPRNETERADRQKFSAVAFGSPGDEKDEIRLQIDAAVAAIERICRPILEAKQG